MTEPEEIAARDRARRRRRCRRRSRCSRCSCPRKGAPPLLGRARAARCPSYSFPENAALALAAAERYGRWRRRPRGHGRSPSIASQRAPSARSSTACSRGRRSRAGSRPTTCATMLRAAGIDVRRRRADRAPADAAATAERLGYPAGRQGGRARAPPQERRRRRHPRSRLGRRGRRRGRDARRAPAARSARRLERVLLQRQVARRHRGAGRRHDRSRRSARWSCAASAACWSSCCATSSFRLTPVTDVDAAEMLDKLRAAPLLDGYRGRPPAIATRSST